MANGCPEAAGWLGDHGARVTIIAAAALGRIDRVKAQIEGASRGELEQAFILGCGYGHTEVGQLLLDHGVDVDADDGRALRLARAYGHAATVAMLTTSGARARS